MQSTENRNEKSDHWVTGIMKMSKNDWYPEALANTPAGALKGVLF